MYDVHNKYNVNFSFHHCRLKITAMAPFGPVCKITQPFIGQLLVCLYVVCNCVKCASTKLQYNGQF